MVTSILTSYQFHPYRSTAMGKTLLVILLLYLQLIDSSMLRPNGPLHAYKRIELKRN